MVRRAEDFFAFNIIGFFFVFSSKTQCYHQPWRAIWRIFGWARHVAVKILPWFQLWNRILQLRVWPMLGASNRTMQFRLVLKTSCFEVKCLRKRRDSIQIIFSLWNYHCQSLSVNWHIDTYDLSIDTNYPVNWHLRTVNSLLQYGSLTYYLSFNIYIYQLTLTICHMTLQIIDKSLVSIDNLKVSFSKRKNKLYGTSARFQKTSVV